MSGCLFFFFFFFFNDTATTEIYTLSLTRRSSDLAWPTHPHPSEASPRPPSPRSEEHTSELQSHSDLVCRLLLEKKKKHKYPILKYKKEKNKTNSKHKINK